MANEQKHGQNQNQSQNQNKGKPIRVPFWGTIKMGFRYIMNLTDEALLAVIFTVPIYAIAYALKVKEITLPLDFTTLWSISFVLFILQNALFRNRGGGGQ